MKEEISKYYTPSLDEFHFGFECEMTGHEMPPQWHKHIVNINTFNEWLFKGNPKIGAAFRVKYLDKEDIESFGFRCIEEQDYTLSFSKPWYNESELILHYYIWYTGLTGSDEFTENRKIHIYQTKGTPIIYKHDNLEEKINVDRNIFLGTIKNKSELKVLLKQLDINE